jgi:hydroxymethylglutaryl-CoA synthase
VNRLSEALDRYQTLSNKLVLRDWDAMVFHLPYAYQGRRMWAEIALDLVTKAERLHEIEAAVGQSQEEAGGPKNLAKLWSKTPHYKAYVKAYIEPGELASQKIGNMYTASIFMALLSTLVESRNKGTDLSNFRVGFLSYGSGSKSKVFSGVVQPSYKDQLNGVFPLYFLDERTTIDFATYEKLHQRAFVEPLAASTGAYLRSIGTEGVHLGYRTYDIA